MSHDANAARVVQDRSLVRQGFCRFVAHAHHRTTMVSHVRRAAKPLADAEYRFLDWKEQYLTDGGSEREGTAPQRQLSPLAVSGV